MKSTSLDPVYAAISADFIPAVDAPTIESLSAMPYTHAVDSLRSYADGMISRGETSQAIMRLQEIDLNLPTPTDNSPQSATTHAAVKMVLVPLLIEADDYDKALQMAAEALTLLAAAPRRKDEPFMAILASLLYDLAYIHSERKEFKQAERNLDKAMRLLERLARTWPGRYGASHILALDAATRVCNDRTQQAAMLSQHQAATSTYLRMVNAGVDDAASRLVDSLASEGLTLARMDRYREAVQYYVRALKFLTRIDDEMTARRLNLSIELGDAMLHLPPMREKAIHLLNTLLHKASRMNCPAEHQRIVEILATSRSRQLDILSLWHKIFPR